MATCDFKSGYPPRRCCDRVATTTLLRYNGELALFCEQHRAELVRICKAAAERGSPAADHWFVLNKIPI